MVPSNLARRQCIGCGARVHGRVQTLADRVSDGEGPGRESARDRSVACCDYGHSFCGWRVVQDESACGDSIGWCDGDGKVWDFLSVKWKST